MKGVPDNEDIETVGLWLHVLRALHTAPKGKSLVNLLMALRLTSKHRLMLALADMGDVEPEPFVYSDFRLRFHITKEGREYLLNHPYVVVEQPIETNAPPNATAATFPEDY